MGVVTGAHGIRGEVKLRSFADKPDAIAAYGPLVTDDGRAVEIVRLRPAKDGFIAALKGVVDRTAAEGLKGARLHVSRERLPTMQAGAFYHHDLIGLTAVLRDGTAFGKVIAIANYGAGDLLDIATDRTSMLVPFTDDYVPEVDLAHGRLVLELPENYQEEG